MSGGSLRAIAVAGRRSYGFSPRDALADELGAWFRVLGEVHDPPAPVADPDDGSPASATR